MSALPSKIKDKLLHLVPFTIKKKTQVKLKNQYFLTNTSD